VQVVHIYVPLSPSSITWYQSKDGDVFWPGRWLQAWRKVMAAYRRGCLRELPAGSLPVHQDQLWAQCSVTSIGGRYLLPNYRRWVLHIDNKYSNVYDHFCSTGAQRFYNDIRIMVGELPSRWWSICLRYITPVILVVSSSFCTVHGYFNSFIITPTGSRHSTHNQYNNTENLQKHKI